MTLESLRGQLSDAAERWLAGALARIEADPAAIRTLFPAAGRACGRDPLPEPRGWTVDDAVRVLLLAALPLTGEPLSAEAADLYRYGGPAEKRAVLRGLALLPIGDAGLPLVRDALRTNDTRLVAAALGPYAAARLDPPAWRHGVLKCVFTGIPLSEVDDLDRRLDAELVRMLRSFAEERTAAGRDVPADVYRLVPDLREV
jgi:hypothetical protein